MSVTAAAPVKNLLIDKVAGGKKYGSPSSSATVLHLPSETIAHHRHPFVPHRVAHSAGFATNLLNVHSIQMDKRPFFIHFWRNA
jgi:hypothetical protein